MFNSLEAPRFNPRKFRFGIVNKDLLVKWNKNQTRDNKISLPYLRDIWYMIAEEINNKVIEERDGVRLPFGLGDLYMGYTKSKKRPVDYKLTKELGKTIYHENWSTDGKLGKLIYATKKTEYRRYIYSNHKKFGFLPHRDFKRSTSKAFKEYPERYKDSQERKYTKRYV